ncbi:MAG: hypothetical protein GW809_06825 [Bacteroidetes bacterium]|nr:hypothetical protein [Bacteroidota bacterium]
MKKILLLIITLFTYNFCFSQKTPGYLGKKLVPTYSLGFAPSFFNPNKNGAKGFFTFNLFHQLRLDYVTSRKSAVGIGFETYSTGIDYDYGYRNDAQDINIRFARHGILNVKGFQLYRSFYSNGIAPMGKRHSLGLKVLFSSTDFEDVGATKTKPDNSNPYSNQITSPYEIKKGGTSKDFGFMYSYSSSRIISDIIVLSFGIDFNVIFSAHFKYFGSIISQDLDDSSPSNQTEEYFLNDKAKQRVFSSQFLMLKIGIGFLAF